MNKTVQIRGVPEAVHRQLRVRAAESGRSLSQYLLDELERIAELPTLEQMRERLYGREPVRGRFSTAALIRADRRSH